MGIKKMIQEHKRKETRVMLVGSDGVNKQDARRKKATTPKAVTRDVQKRMKEYKKGYVEHTIDKVKRYK